MKKLAGILVAVLVVGIVGATFYYLYRKAQRPPEVAKTGSPAMATIVKKTVATGSVVPRQEVEIKPRVSGIVDRVFVEPGNRVKHGDPVAKIDIVPNMVALNDAESQAKLARIALDNAARNLERQSNLRHDGVVAENAFDDAREAHDRAREELQAALDHLELVRKGARRDAAAGTNTVVRATLDGVVLEVPVEAGSSVIESNTFNDGTTIATVADMNELIFKGKVDESEVGKLEPGMDLVLTVGAIEGKTFAAKLEHIAPKGVEEDGAIQFEIRAALADSNGARIRANMSANADIVLDRRDEVLAIEESLLQFEDGKPFVEVETSPQRFEKRAIETGLSDGIRIEVKSGVTAGDKIKVPK